MAGSTPNPNTCNAMCVGGSRKEMRGKCCVGVDKGSPVDPSVDLLVPSHFGSISLSVNVFSGIYQYKINFM